MGLRINTNMASVNAIKNLKVNGEGTQRAMERLSSGKRLNRSMDDVAGLSISESISGQIRGLAQAEKNAQDGISFVQVAEGGLSEYANILTRIRELSTQAASDTIGDTERKFVNVEVQELKKEMNRIANTTEFAGTKLLNGEGKMFEFQVGVRGGEDNRISYDASKNDARISAIGIGAVKVDEKADAREALEVIDGAITKVGAMRAGMGAIQSRMNSTINNVNTFRENMSAARSRIADADIAEESANLAKNTILQQASVATLAQANQSTALALKLI